MKAQESREPVPETAPVYGWGDLRDLGVLWLVNRTVFHPRGYALALEYADGPHPIGWALLGPGDEPYTFAGDPDSEDTEHRRYVAVEQLMRQASEHGRSPHEPQPRDDVDTSYGSGVEGLTAYLLSHPPTADLARRYVGLLPEKPPGPTVMTDSEQRAYLAGGMVAMSALFAPVFGVQDPDSTQAAVQAVVDAEREKRSSS